MNVWTGFMIAQGTVRQSHRFSASRAFLLPLQNRTNLHVSKNSRVLKILIDPITKQTTGVMYEKNGLIYKVAVNKEVVISAGTKMSPQLLMLSGIGPAAHLTEMGIDVQADLPVGQNLQVINYMNRFNIYNFTNFQLLFFCFRITSVLEE
jgi:glucose dehydrogenase (acceptor)